MCYGQGHTNIAATDVDEKNGVEEIYEIHVRSLSLDCVPMVKGSTKTMKNAARTQTKQVAVLEERELFLISSSRQPTYDNRTPSTVIQTIKTRDAIQMKWYHSHSQTPFTYTYVWHLTE